MLLGTRPPEEMPAVYAAADVFCLPSWWEAMPLSVLEAMAAGLPVVATDVGDVGRDRVDDGETGFVVPPRRPEQLAACAAQTLLEDPALRRGGWGTPARARAEHVLGRGHRARDRRPLRPGCPAGVRDDRPVLPRGQPGVDVTAGDAPRQASPSTCAWLAPQPAGCSRSRGRPRGWTARGRLPRGAVALTFDDGFAELHDHALAASSPGTGSRPRCSSSRRP